MRVLWLGNSDDVSGDVPDEARLHRLAARHLEEAAGEPVEVIPRVIWPAPGLEDIIDGWVERYQPQVVVFRINGFWYLYRSVPLLLERRLGRAGRLVARLGLRAGENGWFNRTRVYHWTRAALLRTIGGAAYFTAEEVAEVVEACARRLARHEDLGIVVRGQVFPGTWQWAPIEDKRLVHRRAEDLCRTLHAVHVATDPDGPDPPGEDLWSGGDRLHSNLAAHAAQARVDGEAMVRAWRAANG